VEDVAFGLLAIAAGALFCFRGWLAFRFVITVWGAFVGFALGAGLAASLTDEPYLATGVAWLLALATAVLLGVLAYAFYEVAVVIFMGSIGFALGTNLMVALDVSWSWVIILAGMALGGLLAWAAIASDLPRLLMMILSAAAGATAIVTGIMLFTGAIDTAEFSKDAVTARVEDELWWYFLYGVLASLGIVTQVRAADPWRGPARERWASTASAP
jgi:uncharacterized protein DUF4203